MRLVRGSFVRGSFVRGSVALAILAALALGLALDLDASAPLNPYRSPSLLALGSGEAAGGAHCAALPGAL